MTKILSLLLLLVTLVYSKTTMAVLQFTPIGITVDQANLIYDKFQYEVFNTDKFVMVERSELEAVLKEQNFQQTNCQKSCAVEIGKILGVEKVIIGKVSSTYISVKLIDVQSGKIEMLDFLELSNDYSFTCHKSAYRLLGLETKIDPPIVEKKQSRVFQVCSYCNGKGILNNRVCPECLNRDKYCGSETNYKNKAGKWILISN